MERTAGKEGVVAWRPSVLVVDDEWSTLERIKRSLAEDFEVVTASRAAEAVRAMEQRAFDVVLSDVRMPDRDGLSMVSDFRRLYPETQYILMTAFSEIEDTISAIRLGVSDYLRKPFTEGEVRQALTRSLAHRQLSAELAGLLEDAPSSLAELITRNQKMRQVLVQAQTVAATNVTVLINGETGTGKGLLAQAIHHASARRHKPFVEINCAAIPATLIESELFGHEKGSFTGAVSRKVGRVEMARSGTLFLDEVGEMPLDMQAKLLRFLQEFHFERVGGTKKMRADVRVVAATNRNLRQAVKQGAFRQDLFYRLHVINLILPPLRERGQDVVLLAEHFLRKFRDKYNKSLEGFSPTAREQLVTHAWPGNVRELANAVERAVILARGSLIGDLQVGHEVISLSRPEPAEDQVEPYPLETAPPPAQEPPAAGGTAAPAFDPQASLDQYIDQCEAHYLACQLDRCKGSINKTAKACKVNPKTLYRKMNKHGLSKETYRPGNGKPPAKEN